MIYNNDDSVIIKKTKEQGKVHLINGRWVQIKLNDGSIIKTTTFEISKTEPIKILVSWKDIQDEFYLEFTDVVDGLPKINTNPYSIFKWIEDKFKQEQYSDLDFYRNPPIR